MKKILFALVLIASSAATAFAQTTTAPRGGDEARISLVSKTNELEASLMRNRPEMTQAVLPEVMAMMQERIARNTEAAGALTGDAKMKLSANVKAEQMLYSAFKRMSADPVKNQKEMVSTARKFIEIY